jgi:hypothetical protein
MYIYQNEIEMEQALKPKLYYYPETDKPTAIFDFEELENQEAMLVLCVRQDLDCEHRLNHTCYVWKGYSFDPESHPENSSLTDQQFVSKCIENYWGSQVPHSAVKVVHEDADDTSDDFNFFFGLD